MSTKLCLFVKNQESSVQTGLEEIKKQKKVHQDLLKKKEEFSTQSERHAQEFNKDCYFVITVDGYKFIPDLQFMNDHAVCKYCGQIYMWDYEGKNYNL